MHELQFGIFETRNVQSNFGPGARELHQSDLT